MNLSEIIDEYEELFSDIEEMYAAHEEWQEEEPLFDPYMDSDSYNEMVDEWTAREPELPDESDVERMEYLKEIIEYVESYSHSSNVELIPDYDFTNHVMERLEDLGEIDSNRWYIVIDEEATAENMKQDYTSVDIDGQEYWFD